MVTVWPNWAVGPGVTAICVTVFTFEITSAPGAAGVGLGVKRGSEGPPKVPSTYWAVMKLVRGLTLDGSPLPKYTVRLPGRTNAGERRGKTAWPAPLTSTKPMGLIVVLAPGMNNGLLWLSTEATAPLGMPVPPMSPTTSVVSPGLAASELA